MASEPSGEVLKRLALAMWRGIKPFKKQLIRSIENSAAKSSVFVVDHFFTMYIVLTFQLHFISVNSTIEELTTVRGDYVCAVHMHSLIINYSSHTDWHSRNLTALPGLCLTHDYNLGKT